MDEPTILTNHAGGVLTVTLNRPDKLNALTAAMGDDLRGILDRAREDDAVRVIVLTGAGRGFCSGADLSVPRAGDPSRAERLDNLKWYGRLTLAMAGVDKPVIGAINGVAAGAGFSLALACDIRIASTTARFSSVFIKRGLSPDTGMSFYLPRLVGLARAFELTYTGRLIEAAEAERIGLVNQVIPPAELPKVVGQLAEEIAAGPPIAMQLARRSLQQSLTNDLPAQLALEGRSIAICRDTADFKEGVRSFLEKRSPRFEGR